MRCPNCGHENPEGTLFCEECDWRIDQAVRMKLGVISVYLAYISIALGAVAAIASFASVGIFGVALVAVGMFLGGY
ncbi:MAG: zinc-ribbon domain-containing protein, partial [Candidatus Methanomethylophilaceae archaeon]|nr:zinc-ribbon domain-containing protein [Candidatus Methanomethylophilaceae archaeon]